MLRGLISILMVGLTLACYAGEVSLGGKRGMSYLEARRQINDRIMQINAEQYIVGKVTDVMVTGQNQRTPLRIYSPDGNGSFPLIVFVHGGAWIAGNIETHDNLARYLSHSTHAVVASIGYQNAPEGKYDTILEQCSDALNWVKANKSALKLNDYMALVGDSAGGNIIAALTIVLLNKGEAPSNTLVLINPATDLRCHPTEADPTKNEMCSWIKQYTYSFQDTQRELVSPILSKKLSQFPPTLIVLAEHDPLYDDGLLFAKKLEEEKVPTELFIQKNIGHLAGDGARASKKAMPSLEIVKKYLLEQFGSS